MKTKILFFGSIGAMVGQGEMFLENQKDVKSVKENLTKIYPELENFTYRIALNQEIVDDNPDLNDGDVIALMPPFAGG
ncbi:MAG: MoaD/ThiS family protein [Calditrichaeota bacterium]|nr:MAG: MoaD/ThiS family protein [Calditrichota bacterium]MBL1205717.1 MoaD/ThiS family protein [Calditrichota bacterium]NOG45545.1 MoaD/ThiS family protein [Calditrichota bacterium]